MTNSDLRTAPLFPVIDRDGTPAMLGLRELLVRAHELADLAITVPPAAAGMLRVLYTITARITGLDQQRTHERFTRLRTTILTEHHRLREADVDAYLDKYAHRWRLFDSAWPWMQDPRLVEQAEPKLVNALDITRPGDNSPIWWNHTHAGHAPPIAPDVALQWLLVHLYYGSGGAGGVRRIDGVGDQYMSAGPLRGTVSFYPLGDTLFETLIAGIPTPGTVDEANAGDDVAPWEADVRHDPLGHPPAPSWPAGLLTAQHRHGLLLIPDAESRAVDGCYLTWAWKKRHPPMRDPYAIMERRNDGSWAPRTASADRAVWRDVDALLVENEDYERPAVLLGALSLPDELQDRLRVRAIGFDQDRKATNSAWYTATTPQVIRYMQEHDMARALGARAMHTAAEEIAGVMSSALRNAYRALGTGTPGKPTRDATWLAPAETHYWPRAGELFMQALTAATFDEPHRAYALIAIDAVRAATDHEAHLPAVAREVAAAETYLRNFAAKKDPRPAKETTDGH